FPYRRCDVDEFTPQPAREPQITAAMASEANRPKKGLSLYAELLDQPANSPGVISRAPVVFKQSSETELQPGDTDKKPLLKDPAALRFQPTRRPQLSAPKSKPRQLPKAAPQPQPSAKQASVPAKSTLADWTGLDDDDYAYTREKRQRGGRKKRKKHVETQVYQNWDGLYDPHRPSNYEQYRESDQRYDQPREWKDYMYAHRSKRSLSRDSDSDDYDPSRMRQFAPPMNFAPPPNLNDVPPRAEGPDDPTGEDAFARRAALGQRSDNETTISHAHISHPIPPEAHAGDHTGQDENMRRPQIAENQPPGQNIPPHPPTRPLDAFQPSSATISRAPVRYNLPPPPDDIPASQAELDAVLADEQPVDSEEQDDSAPRSLRPGQQGFAERLLSKYGWTKGSGLGATGSGMVKPLQVKVEKRKKRPDSEGGGFVTPAGRGKIIGSNKKGEYETSKFGPMGEVIILRGMLDGMDLDAEMEGSENGGIMQEIGEECNQKYGTVERVYIARDAGTPVPVFVKFTSSLSALRAVNALEGRVFNGNEIVARFYNPEKFEQGIYTD
ncbi:hypothetical protein N7461_008143, partial [Penicillium sp. DV-2018c]